MIEQLISFFKKPTDETKNTVPEGVCPNCWGEQEYDHMIREMYADQHIDANNHQANYNFIQNVVVARIEGIRLKKGNNVYECPTCRVKGA